ncbi:AVT4, partial [Symbiodinium sp. KB8]
ECDVLSRRLYNYADADFSGDVSGEEILTVLSQLGDELGIPEEEIRTLPVVPAESSETEAEEPPEPPAQAEQHRLWSDSLQKLCVKAGVPKFKEKVLHLLRGPPPGKPRISLGPVIGKVTESSARILVEASHDIEDFSCLAGDCSGPSVSTKTALKERRPTVLKMDGLAPSTLYTVEVSGAKLLVDRCSFRTLPAGGWRLGEGGGRRSPCFAVASCNCVYETRKRGVSRQDLWANLKQRLQSGVPVDYMLHLGDNVYMDSDWHLIESGSMELEAQLLGRKQDCEDDCKWGVARDWLLKLNDPSKWSQHEKEIEEHFRNVYRETWGHPPTRWVLANVPNLMILDDHDIRDDWGDRPEDKQSESVDRFLGEIAYRIFNSYQRLLHEDPVQLPDGTSCEPEFDYHMHVFGDVGLLFVDVRACKTFHWKESEDVCAPMLGQAQWAAIEEALAPGGTLAGCKALLALVPEPLGYVSRAFTQIMGSTVCDDLLGQWSAEAHRAEVPRFLKMLKAWRDKESSPPCKRQVLIVAGDVHEGGWTDLVLHDVEGLWDFMAQRRTHSAADNLGHCQQADEVALTRGFLSSLDVSETGSGWTSRHYDWTNLNNYAFVSAGMAVAGTLKVKVLKAQGLKNQDMLSWLDPYVTLTVGSQTFQTHSDCDDQRDRSSPEWNSEDFQFTVGPSDYYCKLQVCDEDSLMGQDLGSVKLAIHELDTCTQTLVESLGMNRGTLEIQASFVPASGSREEGTHAEDNSSGYPASNVAAPPQVIFTAQLVAAQQGYDVTKTKKRSTSDPVFSTGKNFQNQTMELVSHSFLAVSEAWLSKNVAAFAANDWCDLAADNALDDLRLRLLQEDVSPSDQDAAPSSLSRREKAATRFWRSLAKYFQEHGYRPAASALGSVDRRLTVSGTTGPAAYATPSRRALKANASDPTDYLHAAGSSGEVPFPTHAVAPGQFRRHFLGDQEFQGAEISCHAQLVEFVLDVSFDIQEHYWRMAQAEVELFNAPASSEPESSGVASPVTPSRSRRQSSDLATVLVILKSFLGDTLLVAPGEFLQAGLVSGNLLFCFMGLLELWCMRKLLAAYREVGGGSFGLLALRALGRGGALAVEVSIVASQLGFIATEMIYFAKNGAHATKWLFEKYLPQESMHKDDVIAWLTWGQLLLVVPVAWHRDLASLTAFNFVGNTLVLSTTIFLAVLAAGGLVSSGVAEDLPFLCPVPRGLVFLGFSVFTFEGINMVIPMYESHRDKASFDRILSRTLVAVIAIFATFSTGNVLLYGDGLRPILTLNLAQDSLASTWAAAQDFRRATLTAFRHPQSL